MFRPKQLRNSATGKGSFGADPAYKRAMLTIKLSEGKLLRTFPSVLSPKARNPAKAISRHAIMETKVE